MTEILVGFTDYTKTVYIPDPASTDGSGKTGLAAANLTVSYTRVETDNDVVVTDVTSSLNDLASLTAAHNDWGIKEVSSTLAPGLYRLDIADAVFATGAWSAVVYVMITSSAAAASPIEFDLVAFNKLDGVRLGLTALPNAAADAAGGLPISDAGGLDLDARLDAAVSSRLAPTTAGRTLDVTATGEAGIDWANIGGPTTVVNLSGTTVKTATDVETDTQDIQSRLPAALASGRIDASVGAMAANTLTATAIANDAITAAKIATDAIDADAVADGAITSGVFAAGAITATAIASDAITAAKIADGAIDAATFAAGAINAAAIASDAITAAKIADGAIDAATFAAGAITATVIATDAIDADAMADGAITAATFAAGAIDATAIAADAIGSSELAAAAANEIADALLDRTAGVETGLTVRQALRLAAAALYGKASGLATTTAVYRDTGDSKDRITATVDADGNRTAVTLDAT